MEFSWIKLAYVELLPLVNCCISDLEVNISWGCQNVPVLDETCVESVVCMWEVVALLAWKLCFRACVLIGLFLLMIDLSSWNWLPTHHDECWVDRWWDWWVVTVAEAVIETAWWMVRGAHVQASRLRRYKHAARSPSLRTLARANDPRTCQTLGRTVTYKISSVLESCVVF